jgi:hypothetical protein
VKAAPLSWDTASMVTPFSGVSPASERESPSSQKTLPSIQVARAVAGRTKTAAARRRPQGGIFAKDFMGSSA